MDAKKITIWLARLISIVAVLFFLIFVVGEGISEVARQTGNKIRMEGFVLAGLLVFAGIASLIAWRWKKLGATLLLMAGLFLIIFVIVVANANKMLISGMLGGPFIISAVLYFLVERDKRKTKELMVV
ncbi:MAG: LPXTG cell wall anchor domain-containing protein [Candidatus Parcubacteria bacterium]|nr:LPXTG cell wall anchor domain-containing protein [Candidatus Parcubacteria bacterium]